MQPSSTRLLRVAGTRLKQGFGAAVGALAITLLRLARLTNPDRAAPFVGKLLRRIGPWRNEHRIGRENLKAAYPGKSDAEIEFILAEVWENLGRVSIEYAHLDRLWEFDHSNPFGNRIEYPPGTFERFDRARDDPRPALVFAAHLANWELPAIAAAIYGVRSTILYRAPNIGNVAETINRIRAVNMGELVPAGPDAGLRLAAALGRGRHVGMLVDQHYARGVDVTFFGRPCKANPMLARLARHYDCAIYGVRAVRLPENRFRLEMTDPITPARDAEGRIDIAGTMQVVTSIIEGWVREHPGQWLWLHRRWR